MFEPHYDIAILGAGMAGLTLTRQTLLRADKKILLLDRAPEVPAKRQKVGESTVQVGGYYLSKVLDLEEYLMREHFLKYNLRFYWKRLGSSSRSYEDYSHCYIRMMSNIAGDQFSYSYSFPCSPSGQDFSFQYTNFNSGSSGGTFTMKRLAAVQCLNSRNSALPPGDYDTVSFSGFGTWSKDDPDAAPRFISGQISVSPQAPYVGIIVFQNPDDDDNVVLSSANTKPADKPLP